MKKIEKPTHLILYYKDGVSYNHKAFSKSDLLRCISEMLKDGCSRLEITVC